MSRTLYPLSLLVSLGIMAVAACCPVGKQLLGDPRNPYPLASEPKIGQIVHLPTGISVTARDMAAVAGDARIVYVGETHDNPASHRLELELFTSLAELHPQRQALGMEMFVRSQQPVLDRWVAGKLDEKEFLRESHWFENWKGDFAYYRDLLVFAREHGIPIIALNAEKELVNAVRVKPIDQLSAADQARLPDLDLADPYQQAMTAAFFGDSSHGKLHLDGFTRAQTVWDETMAESIVRYLASPAGTGMHVMVIAGGNHVNYGFGIPRRVFRRLPVSYVTIGGQEINVSKDKESRMMNVDTPAFPLIPYDFLAYVEYGDLPKTGVRLGVMIEPAPQGRGLVVREIVPGSLAERAGLQREDLLLALDGEVMKDHIDVVYALQRKHPGDRITLKAEREGKAMHLEIVIPPAEEKEHHEKP